MAILGATKDGAEDVTARNHDTGAVRIVHTVKQIVVSLTRVAHACTVDVTGGRVRRNLCHGARHAYGAVAHLDEAFAHDVGSLIAAIDGIEDVAARDFNPRITPNTACRTTPYARRNGIVARAAAKHVAEEGVTIGACLGTASRFIKRRFIVIGIHVVTIVIIVNLIVACAIPVGPSVALVEFIMK